MYVEEVVSVHTFDYIESHGFDLPKCITSS